MSTESNTLRIGRIALGNQAEHPVSVALSVSDGEETVFEQQYQFEGDVPTDNVVPSVVIADELPQEAGRFVVTVSHGTTTEEFRLYELSDADCVRLIIEIYDDRIEGYVSSNCQFGATTQNS